MAESFSYAGLIHRHLATRLRSFPSEIIGQILSRCGLEQVDGTVRSSGYGGVTERESFLYKQAIKEVLGVGAYEMTKVNFMMAGCRCQDCGRGL